MEESEGRSCSSLIKCGYDTPIQGTCHLLHLIHTCNLPVFPLELSTVTQAAGVIRQTPHETKAKMDD